MSKSLLNYYKTELLRKLGPNALFSDTISRICRELFGSKFVGVYDSNDIKKFTPNKYYILNTSWSSKSAGIHWVAMYVDNNKNIYIFDSFGRDSNQLLYKLDRIAKRQNYTLVNTNLKQIQKLNEDTCGQFSIAWLLLLHNYGLDMATNIR